MRFLGIALVVAAIGLTACDSGSPSTSTAPSASDARTIEQPVPPPAVGHVESLIAALQSSGRVDVNSTGNRVIIGPARVIEDDPVNIELPGDAVAAWIAPTAGGRWLVVHQDGATSLVDPSVGTVTEIEPPGSFDAAAGPPVVAGVNATSQRAARDPFLDPLPDTRIVTDGIRLVALAAPSDRYAHGVLGDVIEATAIEVVTADGSTTPIRLDEPDVFEAISPMIADIDGDGVDEIVATASNSSTGARLVAYSFDGSLAAQSEPIGQGNRWRNLLAVAPIGPAGEIEVIDVRTPHIGGTLQFFRAEGGRLELVAEAETYSTHQIGSRNLDLGIVVDADGDGTIDVLLPSQDRTELAAIARDAAEASGTREVGRVSLGAELTSNVAASTNSDGTVAVAVGLADGSFLIWS